jgi:CRISPR-associated endonuclease/helicase Cas3
MSSILASYWGKARVQPDGATHHPFSYHCLDVASVAAVWWENDSALRRAFLHECGDEESRVRAWLLFFVALHDLGKLDVRFQLKAHEIAVRLNPIFHDAYASEAKGYDHGPFGHAWCVKEASLYGITPSDEFSDWMKAVAGHHGRTPRGDGANAPQEASPDVVAHDHAARREWVGLLERLFLKPAGLSLANSPPPVPSLLAGFCCVCDWLGSNTDYFPYDPNFSGSPQAYFEGRATLRRHAPQAFTDSGLWRAPSRLSGMTHLFPNIYTPRSVQTLIERLPPTRGLTIIEAATGSGKTEAALAYASRLLAAGLANSVIFALPTQATANAMFSRLEAAAVKLFPDAPNIVLAHGKARFNHKFQNLKRAARGETAQKSDEAYAQCAHWLAQSRKRVFLGQIGVCTIDQVLLSVLPVKHAFVRAFGLLKSVLIIDEVHAYDSYMNGLLDCVLQSQRASGGSAVLLSATLPSARRAEILRRWAVEGAEAEPPSSYPLVTCAHSNAVVSFHLDEAEQRREPQKIVTFSLHASPDILPTEPLIDEIRLAVAQGARVAVICNLVADAQALARRLASLHISLDLFHARYRFADREAIEAHVVAEYGKEAPRTGGRVIVATQVIEQSLDLDFDWLITQVCPVELLFQRLGRLHRHERERPAGFDRPRCTVLTPGETGYGLHAAVYGSPRPLWRTQKLIERETVAAFPAAYRDWIERAANENPWTDEPEAVKAAHEKFEVEELASRYNALQLARKSVNPFDDTDGNAARLTRDGEMSLSVVPILTSARERITLDGIVLSTLDESELDIALDRNVIPAPESWRASLPKAEEEYFFLPMTPVSTDEWEYQTNNTCFTYNKIYGLERKVQ